MQKKGDGTVGSEEWMEVFNRTFSVVEVTGFMMIDFVTGLGVPYLKKVVNSPRPEIQGYQVQNVCDQESQNLTLKLALVSVV